MCNIEGDTGSQNLVHFPILAKSAPGPFLRPYCSLSKAVRIWKLAEVIV